jgi:hypothetical protein
MRRWLGLTRLLGRPTRSQVPARGKKAGRRATGPPGKKVSCFYFFFLLFLFFSNFPNTFSNQIFLNQIK